MQGGNEGKITPRECKIALPVYDAVFRSELIVHEASDVLIDSQKLEKALGLKPYEGFEQVVSIYAAAITQARKTSGPMSWCALSRTRSRKGFGASVGRCRARSEKR